jgi:magnesium transporter
MKGSLKKLLKELFVAVLNGIVIASILFSITYFFFGRAELYFLMVLSFSLIVIIIFATMLGATIPLILKKLNIDPAVATGPFVSTMNDIFGLLLYMTFVTLFLIN